MNAELTILAHNHNWELVLLSEGKNLIGCKWVYKVRTHSDEWYKACLVVK